MICPNCQAEISEGVKFCVKCGTRLQGAAAQVNTASGLTGTPENSAESYTFENETASEDFDASAGLCIKCGHPLKPGMKFCTKCGAPADAASSPSSAATSSADYSSAPSQASAAPSGQSTSAQSRPATGYASIGASSEPDPLLYVPPEKTGFPRSKGIILVIILAIVALIVAILLALKSMGILSSHDSGQSQNVQTTTSGRNNDEDNPEEDEQSAEPEEDPDEAAARLQEIEDIKAAIAVSVEAGDQSEGITEDYPSALDGYITLANDYELGEEVSGEVSEVFDKFVAQVRFSVSLLDGQRVGSGLYIQTMVYYDQLLNYANALKDAGYDIETDWVQAEHDSFRDIYRTKFIEAINEISSRENWSRDEAWALMEDCASVTDENGGRLFFDEGNPDDPVRLRYIYSLAWATRKHLETGFADKSLSAADCLDIIDQTLPETDYNLQLLYDAIFYCGKAGVDATPYKEAYDAIVARLSENDNVLIITNPPVIGTPDNAIYINHFWAFNDISPDAAEVYQVSTTNGTSAATRAWIRENIRVNRK